MKHIVQLTRNKVSLLVCIPVLVVAFLSCNQENKKKKERKIRPSEVKEPLIEANKKLMENEMLDIEDFIKRHQWNMKETGSGLNYQIIKNGSGRKPQQGNLVRIQYKVFFLTGDMFESSIMEFIVGKQDVIAGLHEALQLMHKGDKARFIIPSHLAYGLTGKPGDIPPRTTLIYEIELINIK